MEYDDLIFEYDLLIIAYGALEETPRFYFTKELYEDNKYFTKELDEFISSWIDGIYEDFGVVIKVEYVEPPIRGQYNLSNNFYVDVHFTRG